MGLMDKLTGKKQEETKEEPAPVGKYDEPCSMCGKQSTEKKWMGQYWHKKCLRAVKKGARGMI